MNFTAMLIGDDALIAKLEAASQEINDSLLRRVARLMTTLQSRVDDKLTGDVLQTRTGRLRAAIQEEVDSNRDSILGRVSVSGDVPYAAIQEFGGRTGPHEILPRERRVLAFKLGGETVFTTRVQHPGSTMPERSFLRAALDDMQDEIASELADAAREGLRSIQA